MDKEEFKNLFFEYYRLRQGNNAFRFIKKVEAKDLVRGDPLLLIRNALTELIEEAKNEDETMFYKYLLIRVKSIIVRKFKI